MPTETRYQRIAREQQERQAARERAAKEAFKAQIKRYKAKQNPIADRIDGYDRDDIGLSPDY